MIRITCIHALQIISLEFATSSISNPTLSRQSHKPLIHSRSLVAGAKGAELESHSKDSCGSGESSYRRTRNGELSPFSARLFDLKNAGFKNE